MQGASNHSPRPRIEVIDTALAELLIRNCAPAWRTRIEICRRNSVHRLSLSCIGQLVKSCVQARETERRGRRCPRFCIGPTPRHSRATAPLGEYRVHARPHPGSPGLETPCCPGASAALASCDGNPHAVVFPEPTHIYRAAKGRWWTTASLAAGCRFVLR